MLQKMNSLRSTLYVHRFELLMASLLGMALTAAMAGLERLVLRRGGQR